MVAAISPRWRDRCAARGGSGGARSQGRLAPDSSPRGRDLSRGLGGRAQPAHAGLRGRCARTARAADALAAGVSADRPGGVGTAHARRPRRGVLAPAGERHVSQSSDPHPFDPLSLWERGNSVRPSLPLSRGERGTGGEDWKGVMLSRVLRRPWRICPFLAPTLALSPFWRVCSSRGAP